MGALSWYDKYPWLPSQYHFCGQTPMTLGSENLVAAYLFNAGLSFWNVSLVQPLFSQKEFELVLSMFFRHFGRHNLWTWHFSMYGLYSMKSGCHLFVANHAP